MNEKILIVISISLIIGLAVGGLIARISYNKGFEAGIEWERNIILEDYYRRHCGENCMMS